VSAQPFDSTESPVPAPTRRPNSDNRRIQLVRSVFTIRSDAIVIAETNDPRWPLLTQIKALIAFENDHARVSL
jgi:hypothetical protein